jgi:mRNA-degrading endonuclease toxin of MazEF toxin-antitoxin module
MRIRQWEIWKARPHGVAQDHWFVILSGQERLQSAGFTQINGLACFTLRGSVRSTDVRLNSADGFQAPTVCQCDLIYLLDKSRLHSALGSVSYERQQAIKRKLIEVFRMIPG